MLIKPITVRLFVYGQKANVAAIRKRAHDLLRDEHGKAADSVLDTAFVDAPAADLHTKILATTWDAEAAPKKPTPSQLGLIATLTDVHERMANEWLEELPVAKTCVVFAQWDSHRDGSSWQTLIVDGRRRSEQRAQK